MNDQQNARLKDDASICFMAAILVLICWLMTGCANVSTTRIEYRDAATSLVVEMPKEVEAEELLVDLDAKTGRATVAAKTWKSTNQGTIKAQGKRESEIAGKVAEGAAKGAVKGIKGGP